ncbi:MAG: 2-hydroxychromene-2-carboxylate isomerase [Rhodospirillaceae bacterium]|nr:2-hydroxychromene-2-carboxylate isomerase [Rhodospirillaceae bacterium]MDD9924931.1 2-hydroxychromene-2-carboxylate isomerase [Rhodospirillaceae bacterium]
MADIEYFYSAHSAFAYLGSARFMEIVKAGGHRIVHKPFELGPAIEAGGAGSTRARSSAHRAYYFGREIQRWSEERKAPVVDGIPTHHYNDMALANGMLIACDRQGADTDRLAHCLLEAHWKEDADLAARETLAWLAQTVDIDPGPLLDAALSDEIQAIYQANTQEAVDRSVFGSPTYFVAGDMFYGQDHLEMVERALVKPYAGTWPPPAGE